MCCSNLSFYNTYYIVDYNRSLSFYGAVGPPVAICGAVGQICITFCRIYVMILGGFLPHNV